MQSDFEIKANDGVVLRGKGWMPDGNPEIVVCVVHGLGEHIGRYGRIANYLNNYNMGLVGADLRGHGLSEGKRGHTPNYNTLLDDLEAVIDKVTVDFPGAPVILYGHSMGGNIAANYILRRNKDVIKGAVISSAWFRLAFEPPAFKIKLGKLMNSIYPAFTQYNEIDPNDLCSDPQVVKAYKEDPLVHSKISASLFFNVYEAGLWALDNAEKLKIPALVMHGSADRLTSPKASAEFAGRAGAELKIWEGLKHEPHNEPAHEKVLIYLKDWIVKQTRN